MIDSRLTRVAEAAAALRAALAAEPDRPMELIAMARYHIELDDAAEAAALLRRVRRPPRILPDEMQSVVGQFVEKFGRMPW